jgi:hypothetical protein
VSKPWHEMRLLDPEICSLVRAVEREAGELSHSTDDRLTTAGVFGPIERQTRPNGRARCRECGERIEEGAEAVRFQLDWYVNRFDRWGHAVPAYVHPYDCNGRKEE